MNVLNNNPDKIKILLVDDREENLLTLEAVLSSPDYKIIKASTGDQALRYLLDHEPALILMDVQMPNLDGFETAAIIKKSERTREIPIIFITAIDKEGRFMHKGYDHGAIDYIYKPFDVHILKSKVAAFADLYRKSQRVITAERQLRENESRERERKIAELELRSLRREQAEQKKFRDLVEGIDHGIVWSALPETMAISFVSSRAEHLLGYSSSLWTSEIDFWNNHIHPEDKALFDAACEQAIRTKREVRIEHRFMKANSQIAWLQTGMRLGRKGESGGYELRGLSVDITKLKETQAVLARSKQRSDFLAQASLILSESFSSRDTLRELGKFMATNIADILSVDLLEEGKTFNLSFSENNSSIDTQRFREKFIDDTSTAHGLHKVLSSGHAELYSEAGPTFAVLRKLNLRSVISAPMSMRGKVIGAITFASSQIAYDEEDLLMAKDLAMRISVALDNSSLYRSAQGAVRIRDEFLSVASHELKTPLTPLKLQIQSLMRMLTMGMISSNQPEKISKMLDSSNRQIERLSKLIDDLLDISRISIGKLTLHPEEFDVVKLTQDVIQRFSGQLQNAKCDIHCSFPEKLSVNLDPFRIEQVLVNLLTNAMKYAPGKPIRISLSPKNNHFTFSIQDQGIGIAKEDQARIFMRFERAVSGNHFGGLGLGLYIVSQILEAHGGEVSVSSEPGKGSTFTIKIPRSLEKAPEPEAPDEENYNYANSSMN